MCCCDDKGSCCKGDCCCDEDSFTFQRQFQTKAEKLAELELYLHELKLEVQAVEEHIADLKR